MTRHAYRMIGNLVGGKRRAGGVTPAYLARADGNLAFIEAQGGIRDGMRVLELGTGWVHWEALFLRCFYEVEVLVFDVWDNRQFDGFIAHARGLREALDSLHFRGQERHQRAAALLERVLASRDFAQAYAVLGFSYLIEPTGSLDRIGTGSLDLIFSSDVMEHIPSESLPSLAQGFARVLRPGGMVSQQIVPSDHLCIYAKSAHPKAYLEFSDAHWSRWFENGVQYQNRWQPSDFRRLFNDTGLEILAEEIIGRTDTSALQIAPRWRDYTRADLDTTVIRMIARRPEHRLGDQA
ncbi:MAG: class I SAM-dependent methyltransferase [Erythrobacter sp.]|jgi:cyclopropane fatty-acyl-phospholipid synthase-like methyltransferase|nr:class I SAM-dependent methyltransferase [Erythrobacter sp.]